MAVVLMTTASVLAMLAAGAHVARRRPVGIPHRLTDLTRPMVSPAGDLPPGPASGTSSVPPPVSGPARRHILRQHLR